MEEEKRILRKIGTKNPFTVPEGYFDSFPQELMEKLPEKEPLLSVSEPTLWQRVKPWIYMTAMFCGIMLSVRIFVGEPPKQEEFPITYIEAESLSDEEWEIISDGSMIEDYELYNYLTEAETESHN
ncbi:MAG: hypothetical protein J6C58_05545 [Bacteroidaceae bacterium]|nr:hypothetical protein [Bacteroidaceae bacterium]